jgi:hypothetical protein
VIWNILEVTNSFTLEISMHGKQQISNDRSYKKPKVEQLSKYDFNSIALKLLDSFRKLNNIDVLL